MGCPCLSRNSPESRRWRSGLGSRTGHSLPCSRMPRGDHGQLAIRGKNDPVAADGFYCLLGRPPGRPGGFTAAGWFIVGPRRLVVGCPAPRLTHLQANQP